MAPVVRTQIQLSEEQARRLRRLSHERGESVASIIRTAVDHHLDSGGTVARERASRVIGAFQGDGTAVGREHDAFVADAFDA